MAKKAYRVRNWKDYNKSLVQRGSLTFWFSEDLIQGWENKENNLQRGRRKYYADIVILCALTLRQLYRLPLRSTEGLLGSLVRLMKLCVRVPNYTTLCRRAKTLKINLGVPRIEQARHVLVDSTGIQIIGEGEWKKLRHGETRCQVWKKLHIAMDADNQTILSATITDSVRLDGNYLAGLLNEIKGPISQVSGDGAYDKKSCYQAIYAKGAKATIPPQHNACVQRNKTKKDPALLQRDEVIKYLGRDEDRNERLAIWKRENNYHRRSLVETMMSRMKSIFGDKIRARTFENQRTDLLVRCYTMNKINELGLPKSEAIFG